FSAVWIVVANSWQQTPAGFHIAGEGMQARAEITDFWAMVFNPSSIDRLIHVLLGAFIAGAFLVLSVNAWYLLKNRFVELAKAGFKIALVVATASSLLQLYSGDRSAHNIAIYQPPKLAAFEGHYDSLAHADMFLIGITNPDLKSTSGLRIPGGLSFLLHGNFNTPVKGITAFAEADRPGPHEIKFVFQTYHLMILIGSLIIALTLFACFLWWRGKLFQYRWLMTVFFISVLLPQVANQVGWYSAEVGRQPWVVYGLLKTSDALSRSLQAEQVLFSLILFALVYLMLFVLFLYMMNKKIQHGPVEDGDDEISGSNKRNNPILTPAQ
ncbi:MAG TPA: cytochrome ubiquinol oxidase subunit I, partial [Chitinophagales bacterium]|nr:cytochrome ubiquinol oxidase subunit I [Chitinophagales bacterium]